MASRGVALRQTLGPTTPKMLKPGHLGRSTRVVERGLLAPRTPDDVHVVVEIFSGHPQRGLASDCAPGDGNDEVLSTSSKGTGVFVADLLPPEPEG